MDVASSPSIATTQIISAISPPIDSVLTDQERSFWSATLGMYNPTKQDVIKCLEASNQEERLCDKKKVSELSKRVTFACSIASCSRPYDLDLHEAEFHILSKLKNSSFILTHGKQVLN